MTRQPAALASAASVFASERTPVLVSACTNATTAVSGLAFSAASSLAGSTGVPHSSSTVTTSAPMRSQMLFMRPPNTPLMQMTTFSPGSTILTNDASMPIEPGADITKVTGLLVRKHWRRSVTTSSMTSRNTGSRCPMVGCASAAMTLSGTLDGPGPNSSLYGITRAPFGRAECGAGTGTRLTGLEPERCPHCNRRTRQSKQVEMPAVTIGDTVRPDESSKRDE